MALIKGTEAQDRIGGERSGDYIKNPLSDDIIYAGSGNDTVFLNGKDTVSGGAGNDYLYGPREIYDIYMFGEAGNDYLADGRGNGKLYGGDGLDVLSGSNGNDSLYGGNNNDLLIGGEGNDDVRGESGNDELRGSRGSDNLDGGSGDDTIAGVTAVTASVTGLDVIRNSTKDRDTLTGGSGSDTFILGVSGERPFYVSSGINDLAYIEDFESGRDKIQLSGLSSDYSLGVNSNYTAIYEGEGNSVDGDLVAIVKNTTNLSFSSDFTFV